MGTTGEWPAWVELGAAAIVDPGVLLGYLPGRSARGRELVIGDGAIIRAGTIIYAGTTIGRGFESGHNVVIREENVIGDDFRVWNSTTIDYGCAIGSGVKVHSNCYVAQYSVLEDGVFLAPGVTLANDKYPGQDQEVTLVGPKIRSGAQIGVNVTILPGVEIGAESLVGSGSVVVHDVPPGVVAVGNPTRIIGLVADLRQRIVSGRAARG